jgi:hypothetical protein
MKIDWTVARIDFMEKFSAKVNKCGGVEAALENYEKENLFPPCNNCCFFPYCACGDSTVCYDTIRTAYRKYCQEFNKTTAEKTKEKMLVFIKSDGGTDILRVTAEQNKIIRYFAENDYLLEDVKIYTENTLEYEVTDLT